MNRIGLHCCISGKVQGVWFRASTQKEARDLGLTGWVRNLSDGRVEVMAFGEATNIMQLSKWLKHGPALAEVTECIQEEISWQSMMDFEIK